LRDEEILFLRKNGLSHISQEIKNAISRKTHLKLQLQKSISKQQYSTKTKPKLKIHFEPGRSDYAFVSRGRSSTARQAQDMSGSYYLMLLCFHELWLSVFLYNQLFCKFNSSIVFPYQY